MTGYLANFDSTGKKMADAGTPTHIKTRVLVDVQSEDSPPRLSPKRITNRRVRGSAYVPNVRQAG
jgi:hypothetical protein